MKKVLLLLSFFAFTFSSCHFISGKRVRGSGHIITQTRSVSDFNAVEARGAVDIFVKQDADYAVKLEGDDNLLEYIEVIKEGNTLIIRERRGYNLRSRQGLKVFINAPQFKEINARGASNITSENKISSNENFYVKVSGAGDIKMDVSSPQITARVSGSGNINMKGEAKTFEAKVTGAGDIHCYDMIAENTNVEISGAGNADVYASTRLDAKVSGAGSVNYKGNAAVSQKVSGAGSINKVD